MRKLIGLLLVAVFVGCGTPPAPPSPTLQVQRVNFTVQVGSGFYNQVGHLYSLGPAGTRPLQVTLHGATYTHTYWNAPDSNSYVNRMMGLTDILALDQLGVGDSDVPDSDGLSMSLEQSAFVLHQIVQKLKTPESPTGAAYQKIYLTGHSVGSAIVVRAQAAYHDADALVVTGFVHTPHPLPPVITPDVVTQILSIPYPEYPQALREGLFYDKAGADPAVIAYDSAHMASRAARSQIGIAINAFQDPETTHSKEVTGKVFVLAGDNDALYPGMYADADAKFWYPKAQVTTFVQPKSGHALALHKSAHQGFNALASWLSAL